MWNLQATYTKLCLFVMFTERMNNLDKKNLSHCSAHAFFGVILESVIVYSVCNGFKCHSTVCRLKCVAYS